MTRRSDYKATKADLEAQRDRLRQRLAEASSARERVAVMTSLGQLGERLGRLFGAAATRFTGDQRR
jgi:hypothetical protein